MTAYDYIEPETVEEAVGLLEQHGDDAHLIAGGTSVVLMLRQHLLVPRLLVGLRRLNGLEGIRTPTDGGLELGALTTHRAIERSPDVARYAPALARTFGMVATVRIRNQGTVAGNLAHADPAQDPPPILLVLDATVRVVGTDGPRELPLADLFVDVFETSLAPTDVITTVVLPPRPPGARAVYLKYLPGSKDDYATVSVAASATVSGGTWSDVRIACGAAGPIPMRIAGAERLLEGRSPDAAAIGRAAAIVGASIDPFDDVRGSAEYKRQMAAVWAARALRQLAERA